MDEPTVTPLEQRLMALGARLVVSGIKVDGVDAAHIVADAMDLIDQQHKQLAKLRNDPQPLSKRPIRGGGA